MALLNAVSFKMFQSKRYLHQYFPYVSQSIYKFLKNVLYLQA